MKVMPRKKQMCKVMWLQEEKEQETSCLSSLQLYFLPFGFPENCLYPNIKLPIFAVFSGFYYYIQMIPDLNTPPVCAYSSLSFPYYCICHSFAFACLLAWSYASTKTRTICINQGTNM